MRLLLAVMLVVSCSPLVAQDADDGPAFEVASIKLSDQPPRGPTGPVPPDRFIRRYVPLSFLITYAYQVTAIQLEGIPDWAQNAFFDIEAKADFIPTAAQLRQMVQRLLAERFNLVVHRETKERPRYNLVRARGDARLGAKLRPSDVDCPALMAARGPGYKQPPLDLDQNGFPRPRRPGEPPRCALVTRATPCSMTTYMEGTPIARFVQFLQNQAGRMVVDQTGLTGTYDIEFEALRLNAPVSVRPETQCDGPSLFAALEEQLGLKLEAARGPIELLVVDRVSQLIPD
jgi:uncharacterized protein (TIGR03435 family)